MNPSKLSRQWLADEQPLSSAAFYFLLVLLAVVWFGSIGMRSLISPDEGRYASISLAMVQSGDWITPRLNGLLYFEKPPLQYWVGAIFLHVFGVTAFAARLYPALAGFLTVLLVGFAGARLWGREVGIRGLAIAASMTWIFGNSHYVTLDAGLTLFLTLALCAVLVADHEDTPAPARRRWIWLAWAAIAGAVLSKGLVGLLIPGATLLAVSVWRLDFRLWRGMHWGSGLVVFLLLAAPWFVLVSMRNPGFATFFFIHEHFARYLTTVHQRTGGWWYYLPILLGGLFPWTSGLPFIGRRSESARMHAIDPVDVLLVWSAFVLLFFSASGSKLPSYVLPMFPALALLLALRMEGMPTPVLRWQLVLPVVVWVALLAASPWIQGLKLSSVPPEVLAPLGVGIRVGAVLFLVGAAFAFWSLRRRKLTLAVASLALGHVLAMTAVVQSLDAFGRFKGAAAMVEALGQVAEPGTPVFAVRAYDQTLPFYLGHNVVLVDYWDEFVMGQEREPGVAIATLDAFIERWRQLPRAAAYLGPETFFELHQRGLPMRIVFQDRRRLLVVKP